MTGRRWYQNVMEGPGITVEDPKRKGSRFWNEGKWENFIEPLLPGERRTFIEIGCNAGLYLKMAADAGFRDVIGVEGSRRIMDQAECFREYNKGSYKLVQQRVGVDFEVDQLPLADVTLLANVHYYFPIGVFANLVDRLKSRTLVCVVVSAKAKRRSGCAVHCLDAVRGYFRDWQEVGVIEGLDGRGDPAPRKQMYSVSFKGSLDSRDVESIYALWCRKAVGVGTNERFALPAALEEFFRRVLAGEAFDVEETLLWQYWRARSPRGSLEWIRGKLAGKRLLAEDIQAHGIREPVYYDRRGKLLDGIHRLVIARALGYKHVLVRRL